MSNSYEVSVTLARVQKYTLTDTTGSEYSKSKFYESGRDGLAWGDLAENQQCALLVEEKRDGNGLWVKSARLVGISGGPGPRQSGGGGGTNAAPGGHAKVAGGADTNDRICRQWALYAAIQMLGSGDRIVGKAEALALAAELIGWASEKPAAAPKPEHPLRLACQTLCRELGLLDGPQKGAWVALKAKVFGAVAGQAIADDDLPAAHGMLLSIKNGANELRIDGTIGPKGQQSATTQVAAPAETADVGF